VKQKKILMVCAGNICRSPMAEYLLKKRLNEVGPGCQALEVRSAGTKTYNGTFAGDQTIYVMQARGLDISRHRTRLVDEEIMGWADLVLCMEGEQRDSLHQAYPLAREKVHLITDYCGSGGDISDPTGKPTSAYEECAKKLEELTRALIEKIEKF
jgi:protein-tyrosine-phosphatase